MSHVYMIGDLHFGHSRIPNFRTMFSTEAEHTDYICGNWKTTVTERDVVYVLGDAAFTQAGLERIGELPGRKILVRGNHDGLKTIRYMAVFDEVEGIYPYKHSWLTHCPIHPAELRGRFNVHGHTHAGGPDGDYFDVCCEHIGYTPIRYDKIRERFW